MQDLLGEYSLCHCGHQLPALRPAPVARKKKGSEEEEEETDSDVFQRDIVEVTIIMHTLSAAVFGNLTKKNFFLNVYFHTSPHFSHSNSMAVCEN